MIELLAVATTAPAGGAESPFYSLTHGMMPVILIAVVVMYAMMILPKRKQDKERKSMLSNMKRGDEIQTIGGIIGKIVEAREDRVLVKVDESSNSKIWFTRGSIASVIAEDGKATAGSK